MGITFECCSSREHENEILSTLSSHLKGGAVMNFISAQAMSGGKRPADKKLNGSFPNVSW